MTTTYRTREEVATQARIYPAGLLEGCETGLCLCAAAFLGHNDAIHFALAGITTTCVDIDGARLLEMRDLYPADWFFLKADAWFYAGDARDEGVQWDVVSVDTFTGRDLQRSLDSLDLWCSLARKAVTVTWKTDYTMPLIPDGWKSSVLERASNGVHWLILERA